MKRDVSEQTVPDFVPTVPELLRVGSDRFGDRDCVVTPESRISYAELESRSRTLAARLVASGVSKASRVGLLFPNGPSWVLAWAAAARIGAVVIPVNTFYTAPELGRFLRHADIQYLIGVDSFIHHDYLDRLESVAQELVASDSSSPLYLSRLPQLRRVLLWGDSRVPWASGGYGAQVGHARVPLDVVDEMGRDVSPGDTMLVTYTSGSTGEPKGVVHSHAALIRHGRNLAALCADDETSRVWSPMPLCWVGGFAFGLLRVLTVGGCFLTQEVLDAGAALGFIEREQATYVAAWPEVTAALTNHPDFPRTDLSHLRGGTLLAGLPANRRPSDPGLAVGSLGMTETCGPHTFAAPGEGITGAPERYRGTFGHPVPGIVHRIVDETGKDLPAGEEGEVLVRGYSLMQGLYKRERSEVFDPDGWYHTGDRGYFRDGWFFFTGRQSALIKSAGSNVAPAEVEAALMAQPEVRLAVVVGVPDAQRGEDVVALIVLSDDDPSSVDAGDVRARLRDQLSSYKIPRHIFVIDDERVPWLVSQKVDRRALGDLADALVRGL